jgi:hypothetical protein
VAASDIGDRVELFVVQECIDDRDGVWSEPKKLHTSELLADCEIAEMKAAYDFFGDQELGAVRIVRLIGDVVGVKRG